MSGFSMLFLIEDADNAEDAKKHADTRIGDLYADHLLDEDQQAYIDENKPVLSAEEDIDKFISALKECTAHRKGNIEYYMQKSLSTIYNLGTMTMKDLPVPEGETGERANLLDSLGNNLRIAGCLIGRDFTREGVLWQPDAWKCGVTSEDIAFIQVCPKKWFLVPVVVG